MVKETDILQEIIRKGLQYISTEELRQYALQKKGVNDDNVHKNR